jgi:hypothetical protein
MARMRVAIAPNKRQQGGSTGVPGGSVEISPLALLLVKSPGHMAGASCCEVGTRNQYGGLFVSEWLAEYAQLSEDTDNRPPRLGFRAAFPYIPDHVAYASQAPGAARPGPSMIWPTSMTRCTEDPPVRKFQFSKRQHQLTALN